MLMQLASREKIGIISFSEKPDCGYPKRDLSSLFEQSGPAKFTLASGALVDVIQNALFELDGFNFQTATFANHGDTSLC